ncbi:MAG: zinc metalloprotease HtpX [Candidatus Bathyarchaeia archaeon]
MKFAMGAGIFITLFIFAAFLALVLFIIQVFVAPLTLSLDLVLIVALPLLFVLFQYAIGPSIVKFSTHLQYLKPGENPWLESTVKELADKSKVPMPRLAIVPNNTPNAFVFGRTAHSATLAVHQGLLQNLNEDEVRGVIGHELGHIRHKDYAIMTLLSALPLLAYLVARGTMSAAWLGGGSSNKKNQGSIGAALIIIAVLSFVVYFISQLSVMRLSRLREHYSDAYSAYVTGSPRSLESALTKITYGLSLSPKPPEGVRAFYISDPVQAKQEIHDIIDKKDEYDLDHDGVLNEKELELAMEKEAKSTWKTVNTWFSTHPPTFKRIMLLREIEQEMKTGKYTNDRVYAHV